MTKETLTTPTTPPGPTPPVAPEPGPRRGGKHRTPVLGTLLAAAAGIGAAWWWTSHTTPAPTPAEPSPATGRAAGPADFAMRVEVALPKKGGLGRVVVQPGVVHSFNKAELFAKVSGYLIHQTVDIGDQVQKGQVLAEIDVPELFKSADQARAALALRKAEVQQADARVLTARADRESSAAQLQQAEADIARFLAERAFRQKELNRFTGLFKQQAVQAELVDEQQKRYDAAQAAVNAGEAAVATSKAGVSAADARVAQAQADALAAQAAVAAAAADLAKAEVFVGYTRIVSPYHGVISLRSFHDGDFIRSAADANAPTPVLSVKQNDLMRVIILVPDLDVPYVDRGDPVTIAIDALPGHPFQGKVARFAAAENEQKLMRTEVDLPNPDRLLRDGMYGTATMELEPPSNNLRIPSAALIEQDGQGHGAVYVVRDGKAHHLSITVDKDNGREVEVVQGLAADDPVIVRYSGTLVEGAAVRPEPIKDQ